MTNINERLLQLIINNKSINEISEELKLSPKQILNRLNSLKKEGYNTILKYYYDGEVVLDIEKNHGVNNTNERSIITSHNDTKIKLLVIADTHIGHKLCRLDLLYMIYDYCIKEGINIIINLGDIVEGQTNIISTEVDTKEYYKQINDVLKKYPYDKSILNFICLGNHDYDSLRKAGIDMATIISSSRIDLIPVAYGVGKINIKSDNIVLAHPISGISTTYANAGLVLKGHSHKIKINLENNVINVPSLSDIRQVDSPFLPGALELELEFSYGYFYKGIIKTLLLNNRINGISETRFNFNKDRIIRGEKIKNEEVKIKMKKIGRFMNDSI